jgi:hypothetical protein
MLKRVTDKADQRVLARRARQRRAYQRQRAGIAVARVTYDARVVEALTAAGYLRDGGDIGQAISKMLSEL